MSVKALPSVKSPSSVSVAAKKPEAILQRHATGSRDSTTQPAIVDEVLRSPGQPLNAATRASMEACFGHDFSEVRIHTDVREEESAEAVLARAYTMGHEIVFGHDCYAPHTPTGQGLLAHELVHTIQQQGGSGPQPRPDSSSEREASRIGLSFGRHGEQVGVLETTSVGIASAALSDQEKIRLALGIGPEPLSDEETIRRALGITPPRASGGTHRRSRPLEPISAVLPPPRTAF